VRFRDGITGEGTREDIVITYKPPVGKIGARVARVFTPMFKKMVEERRPQLQALHGYRLRHRYPELPVVYHGTVAHRNKYIILIYYSLFC
jgi:hypothetical protein